MNFKALLKTLRKDPYILRLSLFLSIIYGFVYYWSAGFILFRRGLPLGFMTVSDPAALLWQMRGPFLWEAIAQLNLPILGTLMLSVPNLLIGFLLTLLVYSNLVVVLIGIRHPAYCPINKKRKGNSLVAMFPAILFEKPVASLNSLSKGSINTESTLPSRADMVSVVVLSILVCASVTDLFQTDVLAMS